MIFPRRETKKIIKEKNNHLPVGSVPQQISARETRQQNRRLTTQVQQQINEKRLKQGYQMEQIRGSNRKTEPKINKEKDK